MQTAYVVALRDSSSAEFGGVLFAFDSILRLRRIEIDGNESDYSGGIYAERASLAIDRSTFAGNTASVYGGGLYVPDGEPGKNGGAIRVSTFSDNDAALGGGIMLDDDGIFDGSAEPTLDIVNATIADNQVTVSGGGISAIVGAVLNLDNVTVAYNAADTDNSGGGFGGGLHQSTGAAVEVSDTILAQNTVGSSGGGSACAGDYVDNGGNVITQWSAPCSLAANTLSAQISAAGLSGLAGSSRRAVAPVSVYGETGDPLGGGDVAFRVNGVSRPLRAKELVLATILQPCTEFVM